jgi:hypothetical protein
MDKLNGLCEHHDHHHHSDDDSHHHHDGEECPIGKLKKDIANCHSLNTILTSQKYLGLFDLHDEKKQIE